MLPQMKTSSEEAENSAQPWKHTDLSVCLSVIICGCLPPAAKWQEGGKIELKDFAGALSSVILFAEYTNLGAVRANTASNYGG